MIKLEVSQIAYIQTVLGNHLAPEKVDAIIQDIQSDQERVRQIELESSKRMAKAYGLKYGVGTEFIHRGTLYTIAEVCPNRPKYPYTAENARGTRYKWSESQVEKGLIE